MMNVKNSYPLLLAEILKEVEKEGQLVIFEPSSGAGYLVDGLLAMACRDFDGKNTLENIIVKYENHYAQVLPEIRMELGNFTLELEKLGMLKFSPEMT